MSSTDAPPSGASTPAEIPQVSFALATKMLLSVAALLLGLVIFLIWSSVVLLTQDKQAYVFDTQSTEALLTGRQFVGTIQHLSDTLRLSLSAVDPTRPPDAKESDALASLVGNQSEAAAVAVALLDPKEGKLDPVAFAANAALAGPGSPFADQKALFGALTEEWVKTALPALNEVGVGFVNLSRASAVPAAGMMFADRDHPVKGKLPVAIAVIPLGQFVSDFKGLNLTIANKAGWVLFDTDPARLFSGSSVLDDPLLSTANSVQLATGTQEYSAAGKRYLGGFSKPGFNLVVLARAEWDKAMRATYVLTSKFLLLGCMAIGLGVIFSVIFSKRLTAPINRLYFATQEVSQGNFDLNLEVKGRDEISALTASFNAMSARIRHLLAESVEKAILERELDTASTVQRTLIPQENHDDPRVQIRSHYQSATQCGGDWWGFFTSGDRMVIGIADATGHGVPSALITAAAHSAFSVLRKLADDSPEAQLTPRQLIAYINRAIYASSLGGIMMTYFLGVIDFKAGTLSYCNAGHNPPWLFKPEEGKFKMTSLLSGGQRLGELVDLPPTEERSVPVGPGDILFLYTDGLMEGRSTEGEMFGKKRVRKIVEAKVGAGTNAMVDGAISEFLAFNKGKALDDDVTVVAVRFKEAAPGSA